MRAETMRVEAVRVEAVRVETVQVETKRVEMVLVGTVSVETVHVKTVQKGHFYCRVVCNAECPVMIHQPVGSFSEFIPEVRVLLKLHEILTMVYVQKTGKPFRWLDTCYALPRLHELYHACMSVRSLRVDHHGLR
ncbi:putative endopeptidase Clp [Helianthus anomalus]